MNFITNFAQKNPLLSVIIFSFIIAFFITLLYKKLTDQKKLQQIEKKQKELRDSLKKETDQKKIMEIQKEMIHYSMESLKLSLKPLLISFVPIVIVIGLLDKMYKGLGIEKIFCLGKLCLNWFWTYALFSFIFGLILQKIMKEKPKENGKTTTKENSGTECTGTTTQ